MKYFGKWLFISVMRLDQSCVPYLQGLLVILIIGMLWSAYKMIKIEKMNAERR